MINFKLVRNIAILSSALLLAACPQDRDTVTLRGQDYIVEIADNDAERARGLMFRESLDADRGMLFVFDDLAPRAFWMHNCKIALDILYFDDKLELVSQSLSVPPCNLPPEQCPNYPSLKPAKYVLELAAGTAQQKGVSIGDRLALKLRKR
jgi:uncharacterized protein